MDKPWYKSKTIWGGIAAICVGIGGYLDGDLNAAWSIIVTILGWMGISLRLAVK